MAATTTPTRTFPSAQEMAQLGKELKKFSNGYNVVSEHWQAGAANLTAEYDRRNKVASQLSRAMFLYESDQPRPEFDFIKFLDESTRIDQFRLFFARIRGVLTRTQALQTCFDQTTKTFNMDTFAQLPDNDKIETVEFAFIWDQIKEYSKQLKDLISIIMAQFD